MTNDIPHKGTGHRQRLRDRFLKSGLDGFHDYEVIELLLTLATPRKDCKDQAKAALEKFGTLPAVLEASVEDLCDVKGIGPNNAFGIKFIKAVSDRFLKERLIQADPITNSKLLFDFLYQSMRDKKQEIFLVLFLDAKNHVLKVETLFKGTLTASSVYPREVVKAALENHAAALIFAHNHPSGDPSPSSEDIAITKQLYFACKTMGIAVHEHLIIGNNKYFSFSDHGHIAEISREFERLRT